MTFSVLRSSASAKEGSGSQVRFGFPHSAFTRFHATGLGGLHLASRTSVYHPALGLCEATRWRNRTQPKQNDGVNGVSGYFVLV